MTSTLSRMRQIEERQVEHEVKLLEWSPKMDILAVGLFNGDVSLHRLNWQKIWTVSSPEECTCEALSWRPDGKVLAVGFSNGEVYILDIENNVPVHVNDVGSSITCLSWISCQNEGVSGSSAIDTNFDKKMAAQNESEPEDPWAFLTKLPSLSKAYSYNPSGVEDTEECQRLFQGESPSLLIAGTKDGCISLYMNGFLSCAKTAMNGSFRGTNGASRMNKCLIKNVTVASNLSTVSILCTENDDTNEEIENEGSEQTKLVLFSMPVVASCFDELSTLSDKFGVLEGMMNYISDTLKQISEAWEEILLEMDVKLASYASKLSNDSHSGGSCSMAADFLELLTFGISSPELEHFLLQELTEKGLKKLGHSIDVSYSNVQRLVLKYLHTVSQSLNFHLAELMGQVKASDKYSLILGVTEENIINAQQKAATFWNKGIELQQVIDDSMKSFKAFFRWLYVEILRLSDEDVSEELCKVSQQDICFIAEFLDSFAPEKSEEHDTDSDSKKPHHHKSLERVGQYLKDDFLTQPVDRSNNPWFNFLNENPEFKEIPFIIQVNEKNSLVQEYTNLNASVKAIFSSMNCEMGEKCSLIGEIRFSSISNCIGSNNLLRQHSCPYNEDETKIYGCLGSVSSELQEKGDKIFLYELVCPPSTCRYSPNSNATKKHVLKGLWLSLDKLFSDNDPEVSINSKYLKSIGSYALVDCNFYTWDTISILLNDNMQHLDGTVPGRNIQEQTQKMIQFSLSDAEIYFREIMLSDFCTGNVGDPSIHEENIGLMVKSVFDLTGQACHRELERISSVQFAVSGPRKVAALLFENKKRIRIYDMEVEEASDEDDDENNEMMGGQSSGFSSSELNTSH